MQKQKLKLGGTLPINGTNYTIVGTVKPTLTGETADVYFPIATLQKLAGKSDRVTQIFVTAKNSNDVDGRGRDQAGVARRRGVTSKQLADQASGSLSDAQARRQPRWRARIHRADRRAHHRGAAHAVVDRKACAGDRRSKGRVVRASR
jgi:hypothetical protein